jgi:hypothetical protein
MMRTQKRFYAQAVTLADIGRESDDRYQNYEKS